MALKEAQKAADKDEVPIGAVLVHNGKAIARGHNLTRTRHDPTAHAEMIVLKKASRVLKNERLLNTTLYVTLEPCVMCAGAIVQARVPTVVFGASEVNAGACGSAFEILPNKKLNHRPVVIKDILAEESAAVLKNFFKMKRKKTTVL